MNRSSISRAILGSSLALIGLSSCDAAKKFIDPSGTAYNTPPDTTKPKADASGKKSEPSPQSASTAPAPTASPARKASPTQRDVPPLSSQGAISAASKMLLTTSDGWVEFHGGRAFSRGRNLTLWGEAETPWGLAITDLDQDGAEDAIIAVRSTSRTDTSWSLAVLTDHAGKLQCVQNIPLSGLDGVASMEATQGGVLVTTPAGQTRLFGWVAGQLVGN